MQQEFQDYKNITVTGVIADVFLRIKERNLTAKLEQFKNHHVIMDEVCIQDESDIAMIKNVAEKCGSLFFWCAVTNIYKISSNTDWDIDSLFQPFASSSSPTDNETRLRSELSDFLILKHELNLPLRNTASITHHAYNTNKSDLKIIHYIFLKVN